MPRTGVDRWEQRTEIPLLIASLVFLTAYAVPILDTGLSPAHRRWWNLAYWGTWLLFAVEYAVRMFRAPRLRVFLRANWLDALVLALPVLRPLHAVRVLTTVRQVHRRWVRFGFHLHVMTYAGITAVLLGFTGSLALLQAERGRPGANIESFGDALWCTITTISTVGYGETYPVTPQGRVIAVGLMTGGVALVSVVTATFASWFVSRFQGADAPEQRTQQMVRELTEEVRALRSEQPGGKRGGPGTP